MTNRKLFLGILKSFLHPKEKLPNIKKMNREDWEEVLHMAEIHAVLPIVYEAAWDKDSFQRLPEQERNRYKAKVRQMIVVQTQATSLFLELYRSMLNLGVTPLVIKGIVCRNMYKLSDYRVSCDEDLLVKREEFSRMDQILLQRGFRRDQIDHISRVQEVSYYHPGNGLHLEVHLDLFSEDESAYGHLNREFTDVFDRQIIMKIQGVDIHTMSETQHMFYLLCHGLKHLLHSGFGIRQLMDMVLFAETYGDAIDWNDIKKRTIRQNMYVFWMNLFDIGEQYLGFSWKKAHLKKPDKEILDSEDMLDELLESGVFGKSSEERIHSANITLQAAEQKKKKHFRLRKSLFPGIEYMSHQYPYLVEKNWLLPVAWMQRIVTYGRKMRGSGAARTVEIGQQRVKLLKKYGIVEE